MEKEADNEFYRRLDMLLRRQGRVGGRRYSGMNPETLEFGPTDRPRRRSWNRPGLITDGWLFTKRFYKPAGIPGSEKGARAEHRPVVVIVRAGCWGGRPQANVA